MPAIAAWKTSSIVGTLARTSSATIGQDKQFDPDGIDTKGVAAWADRSGGQAVNYPRLTLSVRRPLPGSRMYKVTAKIVLPTPDITAPTTVTGIQPAPTKAYENTCVIEFMLPERGTNAERLALFNHVHSLFLSTINASDDAPSDVTGSPLLAAVQNFDPPY